MSPDQVPPAGRDRDACDRDRGVDVRDAQLLLSHPLVAPLNEEERSVLLECVRVDRVPAGTTLIAAGARRAPLLLVLDGTARVVGDGAEIAVVRTGSWVGELALLDDRPSRYDVVAGEDMVVGSLTPDDARRALDLDPVALQLDSVARRRRAANRASAVDPVTLELHDGGVVQLRPLRAADWRALATGGVHVSTRSLEMRFFVQPPRTERSFRRLTDIDWRDEFAWAVIADDRLIGIGRYAIQAEDRGAAELALLVADDFQRRGIGRVLVDAICITAAVHGASDLIAVARAANEPVQRLLNRYGADFRPTRDEGVVRARWPVAIALAGIEDRRLRAAITRVALTALGPVLDP